MTTKRWASLSRALKTLPIVLLAPAFATGCPKGLGKAACPALRNDVNALEAAFNSGYADGKIAAFVQASKDMAWASNQLEMEIAGACERIGRDIGIPPQQMQPRKGDGGRAAGACEPVAAAIDAFQRQGVRLWVTMQPPQCTANANAHARCAGRCDVNNDAECRASCQAHANAHAECTPVVVNVRATHGADQAARLMASLQANLPALLQAQITLGERLAQDAQIIAQVGANLPNVVGQASAQALACIAAAADVATSATVRIRISVRASVDVSSRVRG